MMNRRFKPGLYAFTLLTLLLLAAVLPVKAGLNPDFELVSLEGEATMLQSHVAEGKWLLVMFWASDCGICKRQQPQISKFHQDHKDTEAQVIGIALDGYENIDDIRAYIAEQKPGFPSFTGDYIDIARRYNQATGALLRGTPTYLLYTPDGTLVANNPGPLSEGSIARFIEKYRKSLD